MHPAIRVQNLGKQYRLGAQEERFRTLRETIVETVKSPWTRLRVGGNPEKSETFWALKGVSFDVQPGEVIGIIGRNGAGKSTLLKVLSRITQPTTGRIELRGRVASLLEVGTGFHPELTGRENIYLNGVILGMKKTEIVKKFDEIVAFAEIEKFLDTPVKRYSSGMYVRLAFAVAAHLEPEILIVDEVLAVGDAGFQKKCLGKMGEVAREGRTVVFVSHNMASVQSLCSRGILLQSGKLLCDGSVKQVIQQYLLSVEAQVGKQPLFQRQDRIGGDRFSFQEVEFLDAVSMAPLSVLISGQAILIRVKYKSLGENTLKDVVVSISFYTQYGTFLFACRSDAVGTTFQINQQEGFLVCLIKQWPLNLGKYFYNLIASVNEITLDWVREAGFIEVERGDFYGTGILPAPNHQGVFIYYEWKDRIQA